MGLDQYAYVAAKAGQRDEFYETSEYNEETKEWVSKTAKPREIAYWRKHPNLQGWMEKLWEHKLAAEGQTPEAGQFGSTFNGVELELTWEDLDALERAVTHNQLPETSGFFFGNPAEETQAPNLTYHHSVCERGDDEICKSALLASSYNIANLTVIEEGIFLVHFISTLACC